MSKKAKDWGRKKNDAKLTPCLETIYFPVNSSFFHRMITMDKLEVPFHYHPEFEISYFIQGFGTRYVGDSIFPFSSGDLVLLGENLPHTWIFDPSCKKVEVVTIQFNLDAIWNNFQKLPEFIIWDDFKARAELGLCPLGIEADKIKKILLKMNREEGLQKLLHLFEVLYLFSICSNVKQLSTTRANNLSNPQSDERMIKVIQFLENQYTDNITLKDAAKIACMNPVAFSRYCKEKTGINFNILLRTIRIGKACQLLQNTPLPISTIAHETGYENLGTFNRQFLEEKKISPSNLRKKFRSINVKIWGD